LHFSQCFPLISIALLSVFPIDLYCTSLSVSHWPLLHFSQCFPLISIALLSASLKTWWSIELQYSNCFRCSFVWISFFCIAVMSCMSFRQNYHKLGQ